MTRPVLLSLLALAVPIGGCEPLRGVESEKDQSGLVDVACVDKSLRKTFGEVERWDYVSDGNAFAGGTNFAQFAYFQSDIGHGRATLEIGKVGSRSRLRHSFTGIGAALPKQDFPSAFRAMARARAALWAECALDLQNMKLSAVGQHVEGLEQANAEIAP